MTKTISVTLPKESLHSVQGVIEHVAKQLLRHDEPAVKASRRFSSFDCQYLSKMLGDLIEIRECICTSFEKQI